MSRVTPYVKTNWEDTPLTSSPINSIHLNHLETGVKNVTDAVNEMVVEVEPATASKLGGIKVGSGLSVTKDGTLSANAQPLEPATQNTLGGIKVGSGLSVTQDGTLSANGGGASELNDLDDVEVSNPTSGQVLKYNSTTSKFENSDEGGSYVLPTADNLTKGGVKVSGIGLQMTGSNNEFIGINVGQGLAIANGTQAITLKEAGTSSLGGVRLGSGLTTETKQSKLYAALKKASTSEIGGIIVGEGFDISDGVLSLAEATTEQLGGVMVDDDTIIIDDGVISANLPEDLSYTDTMDILESNPVTITFFKEGGTITKSGPFVTNPAPIVINAETGLLTFNNTGTSNYSSWFVINATNLERIIPSGSKIILDGDHDGLYLQYRGQLLNEGVVTSDLVGTDIALYINVENGKTYDISCICKVIIP